MQDQNQKSTIKQQTEEDPRKVAEAMVSRASQGDFVKKIAEKIKNSENILVAMSKNPSVDDFAAAIALTMFLDALAHHVTAIYSGKTPDKLAFLRPDATFESDTGSLQDFIIALNKDKADHLRYKLEGDFVKVFITPYKTTISEKDLTFMRGDYNVDFVIAINVRSAGDLDEALTEHGRIMHDASIVDITAGEPGRFGEIEWSDPTASSVSEMVTKLVFEVQGQDTTLDVDVATALLTGIVAATDRFSNNRTSPNTLTLASKLMSVGADQQLISANIIDNVAQQQPSQASGAVPNAATGATNPTNTAMINPIVGFNNPASQIAQGLNAVTGPDPANVAIPAMAPATPIDSAATIIKPIILGVTDVQKPEVVAEPTNAPIVEAKAMATTAPVLPSAPMVGMNITPPEPTNDQNVNYANMLQQALTEETPIAPPAMNPGVAISPQMAGEETMNLPPAPGSQSNAGQFGSGQFNGTSVANGQVAPAAPAVVSDALPPAPGEQGSAVAANPVTSSPTMVLPGQPVERQDVVLPPPPAPATGSSMMPPSMPSPM